MNISILHLSDLHIIDKNGTYSEVLDNLIDDVKQRCISLKQIILVVTGDLIDKALYTNKTKEITLKFFTNLHNAIGDKIIGIEITPGNHDKERQNINKSLIDNKRELDDIPNIDIKDWDYFLVPYKNYIELSNEIRRIFNKNSIINHNTYYVESIDTKKIKIIFINIDTSWASYGGIEDKRKLCLDIRQLEELKDQYQQEKRDISKPYLTIMTAHHPLDWLKEKDEALLNTWLLNSEYFNIDFYLCGHTHDRQIKSFFDTYKSYITLVTGIGWDERTADEQKDKHRYSIYNLNLKNNSCEIIIRKTCTNGSFDYDNDVLLTDEEKENKRIYLPIKPFYNRPVIKIPVYTIQGLKTDYLFIDNTVLDKIKTISEIFCDVSIHMAQFQSMHVRDFFIKYELNKSSKGTVIKQEIYDDYFYKNMDNSKIDELFSNIKNYSIIYNNFLSYLRELCGAIVSGFKEKFDAIEHIRLHFRKFYKDEDLYIAFCQASDDNGSTPPDIRDLKYDSLIKLSFETKESLVYLHNIEHNPLNMRKNKYENFISMAPNISQNVYSYKIQRKEMLRPFLSASLSIKCINNSNILDILNYLDIGSFIFHLIFDYVTLFKIDMEKFIQEVNV